MTLRCDEKIWKKIYKYENIIEVTLKLVTPMSKPSCFSSNVFWSSCRRNSEKENFFRILCRNVYEGWDTRSERKIFKYLGSKWRWGVIKKYEGRYWSVKISLMLFKMRGYFNGDMPSHISCILFCLLQEKFLKRKNYFRN